MDAIYTYRHYGQDNRPRLQFPKRTGRRTTYAQWLAYQYALHHDDELPAAALATEPPPPPAPAFVNHGRWLWQCPACMTAVQVCDDNTVDGADLICCPACFSQGFVQPEFPDARAEIEAELLRQPGYRHNAPFRNWEPGWGIDYLQERTAAAQAKIAAGETFIRSASIGTPRTWAVGEILRAADMNTFIREIQKDLIGTNGAVELLHGMRPGSFTTAEVNALSGIVDGVMLYNSTTQRHEYFVGGNRRGFAGVHESGLFAAGEIVTVSHDLGFAPTRFQLLYERVGAAAQHGHGNGDRVYVGEGGLPPGWAVFDVTATSYKVAAVAAIQTDLWAIDRAGNELWRFRGGNPSDLTGGYGNQGTLPATLTTAEGLAYFDSAFWTVRSQNVPQLWKINPVDPDQTTGGYGNQGSIPTGIGTGATGMFVYDNALWVSVDSGPNPRVMKIDHTSPGNTSGDFGTTQSLPAGAGNGYMTVFDGAAWSIDDDPDLWKYDPTDWDSTTGDFGEQGDVYSALANNDGIDYHNGVIWAVRDGSVYKMDPGNPLADSGDFGLVGAVSSTFTNPMGMVARDGSTSQVAQITAASGDLAGFAAEITVDNDASVGGWGARMLAFA